MALLPGSRLGPYEVIAQIGVGGMGEVYRATDTSLRRSVAIKVLPDSVVGDTERLARFQREAEVLAAFNHPNIAAIYGLERSTATTALVMELVEGATLADRIDQGAVPIDEALSIAKQIADALEAAHEQNIIHRDLKPANIKVRPDGTVKVLDFGLAKAMEPTGAMSASLSMSPTITTPAMTQAGMILGTAAYMSPEQARGKPVDKRADIWAFGAVLFEMLTGKRAFPGEDITDTLAAVVRADPDWDALPADLPSALRAYLTRCLQKDPRQRVQAIGDVRLALTGAFETATPQGTTTATSATPRGRLIWMASLASAAVVIVSLAVPTLQHLRERPPPEIRTEIVTPVTDQPTSIALSPDGQQIVFVASDGGGSRLWLRFLATTTAQPLTGTEGATDPFWSPDSRAIGFFARGALKRLDVGGGGAPQTLAPVITGRGGTWNSDGVIVFAPSEGTNLMRVSATGGTAAAVTTLGSQQVAHRFPHFLPDGRRFLFNMRSASNTEAIYLGALDGGAPTRLTPADSRAVYLPSGWLLWVRAGALVAQRLDAAQATLTGEPLTLAEGVAVVSVAATGLVAYRTAADGRRQLAWFDRSGTARGVGGSPDGNDLQHPRVSHDGRRMVVTRTVQGNMDLWLIDGARTSRVTFDAERDMFPLWSPDGTRIVFRSNRAGAFDLYQKLANGAGMEERLVASDQVKVPTSWSAVNRVLMYYSLDPQTSADLWVMPMTGDPTPAVFLKTPFREVWGAFSPDGRWVPVQRIGDAGDLRAAVCSSGQRRGSGRRTVAGVHGGRDHAPLAARRKGAVLPQPRGRDDGGAGHRHRVHARTGRAGGALSHADLWWRRGLAASSPVRRRPRWALPHQLGRGRRLSTDHAPAELESRREAATLALKITP